MIPLLWLCGPPGVGKTAVAWDVYQRLQRAGRAPAYVDVDQLGMCDPARASDRSRHGLQARNIGALRASYSVAGARCLIVSGVVDPRRGRDAESVGRGEILVCRLRADPVALVERLGARLGSVADAHSLAHEADVLDESRFTEWCIDTTHRAVARVADDVIAELGEWPGDAGDPRRRRESLQRADAESGSGRVLWLCGPTGVGKSTVGFHVFLDALNSGVAAAYVDVDQLAFFGTGSADHVLRARNVAGVWRNFRAAGADALVAVGSIATRSDALTYERSLRNASFTWCRLDAGEAELTARVLTRRAGGSWAQPGDPLRGRTADELRDVVTRSLADAHRLEAHGCGVRIEVDGLSAAETADRIRARTGWLVPHP
jgi:adenylylsulfate kinase-like enzyme